MTLSKKDRLIIANQLKILEKLYPEESDYYSQHRTAVEGGYVLHYSWMLEHFSEEMSEDKCRQVLDVLDMYRAISFSSNSIQDTSDVDSHYWFRFRGFDANQEPRQYSYAQYFIVDLNRYTELKYGNDYPDLNSHSPTLEKYEKMLEAWKGFRRSHKLTEQQLRDLLEA